MQNRLFVLAGLLLTLVLTFTACETPAGEDSIDAQPPIMAMEASGIPFPEVTETVELEPADIPNFEQLTTQANYQSFLDQYGVEAASSAIWADTDWDKHYYLLTYETETAAEVHLALYPTGDEFYVAIWELEAYDETEEIYAAYSFHDYAYLGSIAGSVTGDDGGVLLKPTCRESSSSFKACVVCGVGELMSDPASRFTCTLSPHTMALCAAAIGLHCSFGEYPDTN